METVFERNSTGSSGDKANCFVLDAGGGEESSSLRVANVVLLFTIGVTESIEIPE